jgi:MFS family permease
MAEIARQGNFIVAVLSAAIGYAVMVLVMTATPLSMRAQGYDMNQVATIMQWHVLGMFAPSFITGSLIARFGVGKVLLTGSVLLVATTGIAISGQSMAHYWFALVLLGVGWNFLFVGGSALVARSHTEAERGKVQGVNDLIIFSFVALGSLMSGTLLHWLGWNLLNLMMLPLVLIVLLATIWMMVRQSAETRQAPAH